MYQRTQMYQNGGALSIHDTILNPFFISGQNVFLPHGGSVSEVEGRTQTPQWTSYIPPPHFSH